MKTRASCLFTISLLGVFCLQSGALDFRIKSLTVADLDGATTDYYFDDQGKRIFYRPPANWQIEQSSDRLLLHPPEPMGGEVSLETFKPSGELAPPGTSDQAVMKGYEKLALSLLPPDAKAGKIFESATGLFGGRELPMSRIGISYDIGGRRRCATYCFVLYKPADYLRVTIKSLEEDYAAVHGTALHSLEAFTPES